MADDELRTLVRSATPPSSTVPDTSMLWNEGRRRRRRAMTAKVATVAACVLVFAGVGVVLVAQNRHGTDIVLSSQGTVPASRPSSSAGSPADANLDAPADFPVTMRVSRTEFRAGDGGEVEVGLEPTAPSRGDSTGSCATTSCPTTAPQQLANVTVAIPLSLESWDPATGTWTTTYDLYDMSRSSRAFWQPHNTGPAWYERTVGAWGLPARLPVDELRPGINRLCVRAWRGTDDPPGIAPTPPPSTIPGEIIPADRAGFSRPSDAVSISRLAVPASAVTMCRAVQLSSDASTPASSPSSTNPPATAQPSSTVGPVSTSTPATVPAPTTTKATTPTTTSDPWAIGTTHSVQLALQGDCWNGFGVTLPGDIGWRVQPTSQLPPAWGRGPVNGSMTITGEHSAEFVAGDVRVVMYGGKGAAFTAQCDPRPY